MPSEGERPWQAVLGLKAGLLPLQSRSGMSSVTLISLIHVRGWIIRPFRASGLLPPLAATRGLPQRRLGISSIPTLWIILLINMWITLLRTSAVWEKSRRVWEKSRRNTTYTGRSPDTYY
jgi:hypothetical protein